VERFTFFEEKFAAFFDNLIAQGVVKPGVNAKWANALLEGMMKSAFRMRQRGWESDSNLGNLLWDAYQSAIFEPQALQDARAAS
jgi:hypothetical protein